MKSYSQSGEDLVLRQIFDTIGDGDKTCVEFGAADGVWLSNTKLFRDAGWKSWLFDIAPRAPEVIKAAIHPDNVDDVFDQHGVPDVIDLLSIDVDGQDIWILDRLKRKARVVIIEFNPYIPQNEPLATPYPGAFTSMNRRTRQYHPYFGASPSALSVVGKRKGMKVHSIAGVNLVLSSEIGTDDYEFENAPMVPYRWKCIRRKPWTRVE